MSTATNLLLPSLLALSLSSQSALAPSAAARNVFDDFTKAPTFTPPAGCIPTEQTYGVVSRCEKTIEPGHTFVAPIDTAMGVAATTEFFVTDQVKDFKSYWQHDYPGKNLAFSSHVSNIVPGGNRASHGTNCIEYSITELDNPTGNPPVQTLWRVEGLTCAWFVDDPKPGKATIEQFWLEASDGYDPAKGQKPMESFDSIVRKLFVSVRLLVPRAYLVPPDAAKNAMLDWTEIDVNACFGASTGSNAVAGLTRYFYSRGDCKPGFIFRNGKVHSVEGYGSEQECWWVMDACEKGKNFQEAPRDKWQRWTIGEVAACFGERTENPASFKVHPLSTEWKENPMHTERDGCSMNFDLEATQRLSIFYWSEAENGACRRLLQKCEEILPSKF
jgi:hypothetical protein